MGMRNANTPFVVAVLVLLLIQAPGGGGRGASASTFLYSPRTGRGPEALLQSVGGRNVCPPLCVRSHDTARLTPVASTHSAWSVPMRLREHAWNSATHVMAAAAAGVGAAIVPPTNLLKSRLVLGAYILLWYAFSLGYNIYFKRALNAFPYPWACALWQISFGWFIFGPLWALGLRQVPKLRRQDVVTILPAALGNLILHVGAVIAFFGGAVSFVHVVKASEPVVSCLLSFLFLGEVLAWPVYAALVPIIAGVALASAKELSFTWLAFGGAMASNLGSSGRAVYTKKVLSGKGIGENMDSANTFSVLTIIGMCLLAPMAFVAESPASMLQGFRAAVALHGTDFLWNMFGSGLCYYLYNEIAFLALGRLDAVSHAVANTIKRVVIIVAAVIVFGTKMTPLGAVGSGLAVLGTLLYSLAKTQTSKSGNR